ncbi:MAG: TonB-dependent receptor [Ketobacter sp.]|nr:MAG: TonB-dependent receptor [Ketobacter sp.]
MSSQPQPITKGIPMKIHHLPRVLSKTGLLASSMAMVLSAPSTSFAAEGFALLEEIIITARKRAESLQDTPISVAAFSADSLNDRQIESADQLTQVTPNLSFSSYAPSAGNNASSQIFIRGIGQTEFLPTTDPGVGLYIDEVYMARSVGATIDFVDLEQIEILRGPQGTLFGRNTIGGAINITTRKPGEEFGGSIDLKAGSDNRQEARVTIDMPVSENLLTTISVGSRKRDGYVDRILTGDELGDDESLGGRFAVLWTPTDNSSYYLTSDYVKENEGGSPIVFNGLGITQPPNLFAFLAINGILSAPLGTPSCATLDASLQARCTSGDWDADQEKSFGTFPVESYFETWGTSLTASWDLEWMSIKSITAYRDMEWTGSRDADSTPLQILHTRNDDTQEQFSQEMQFSGIAMDDKLNWLAGLYYFKEEASDDYFVPVAVGTFNSGGLVENDSQAVFGQLTYDLSDRLALTLGARWTEENKAFKPLQFAETAYLFPVAPSEIAGGVYVHPFDGNTYPLAFGGVAASVPAGTLFFPEEWREESYSDTTFMANLAYEITDSIMLYGSFSEGFKSGGFNARNVKPGVEVRTFSPELATTYELGFKADLLDGSLRLNGAVFQTDYEDLQFVIREDFAPIVFNAGESEIRGLELEWTWIPTSALQIVGGLGYVDAEYKSLDAELQAAGVTTANEMPHVPELSANLGVAYTFNLSSGTTLTPRIDWSYRDDVFFDALNQTDIDQTGYDIVNASVSWENTDETINVVLAATNLGFWGFSPLKRQKSL